MHGSNNHLQAPLFPLPNALLFPGCVMPLHIFEERYRQMIGDLLDGPGRMVMGNLICESELAADGPCTTDTSDLAHARGPRVHTIGGLGEIVRHEREPDGRFHIWLLGQSRVRIEEVPSTRAYRMVDVELLEEIDVAKCKAPLLRERLQKAILARCDQFLNLPSNMPISALVDLLSQRIPLPASARQRLYAELDVERRALATLCEHERRPQIPPPDPKTFLA